MQSGILSTLSISSEPTAIWLTLQKFSMAGWFIEKAMLFLVPPLIE
jgi:hypothetical protein